MHCEPSEKNFGHHRCAGEARPMNIIRPTPTPYKIYKIFTNTGTYFVILSSHFISCVM